MRVTTGFMLVAIAGCVLCLSCRPAAAQTKTDAVGAIDQDAIRQEIIAAWTKRQAAVSSFMITYQTTVIKTPEGLAHQRKVMAMLGEGNANKKPAQIEGGSSYCLTHQITMQDRFLRTEYWSYRTADEQQNALAKLTPGEGSDDLVVSNGKESTSLNPKGRGRRDGVEWTFRKVSLKNEDGYDLSTVDTSLIFKVIRGMSPEVQKRFSLETAKFEIKHNNQEDADQIVCIHDDPAWGHISKLTLDRSRGYLPVEYKSVNRQGGQASLITTIDYPEDEAMPLFPSGWTTSWILPDGGLRRVDLVRVSQVLINELPITPETFEIPILEETMVCNDRTEDRKLRFTIMYAGKLQPFNPVKETYPEALTRIKTEAAARE